MATTGRHVAGSGSPESHDTQPETSGGLFFAPGYRITDSHTPGGSMSKRKTFAYGRIVQGVIIYLWRGA